MESTVEDMWQMVVENKCKTIVLLCSLIEDGKVRDLVKRTPSS